MFSVNKTFSSYCTAYQEPTKVSTITASIVMTIFLILGIFGNAWTLWILISCRRLRKNLINDLIISLCTNDLINLTLVQTFVVVSYYFNQWITGTLTCYIVPEANMILIGTSLWHHAFIAFHRYLVVVRWNFYLRIRNKVYLLVVILGSRVFPLILSIVFNSISYKKYRLSPSKNPASPENTISNIESFSKSIMFYSPYLLRCVYKSDEKERIICVLFLTVILPCIIVSVCFTAIFIFIRRNSLNMIKRMRNQNGAQIEIRVRSHVSTSENICSEPPPFKGDEFRNSCELINTTQTLYEDSNYPNSTQLNKSADPLPRWTKVPAVQRKRLHSSINADKKRLSREMSITKMFGVVFLLFIAGYLPYGIIRMIDRTNIDPGKCSIISIANSTNGFSKTSGTPPEVYVFISVLYAIASCCNPLIFGAMHKDVRKNANRSLKNLRNLI
ncbi:unnamed protein product [Hymenolepis diminuta]|uniref:G_PROTEIN_RECEP_F1_2 domain-containing protein n=1 Tax=Hymenolepis diminuta TaxID=6216 RepID=A0A0R3SK04_HYMDI|nr:unnamed protein product [Hymenolepis diminuta]VUZ45004.1 unnamed protein product [Hymenolepis diminuta]